MSAIFSNLSNVDICAISLVRAANLGDLRHAKRNMSVAEKVQSAGVSVSPGSMIPGLPTVCVPVSAVGGAMLDDVWDNKCRLLGMAIY